MGDESHHGSIICELNNVTECTGGGSVHNPEGDLCLELLVRMSGREFSYLLSVGKEIQHSVAQRW